MLLIIDEEFYFSFGYLKIWPEYFKLIFYGIDFVSQKQNYNKPSIKKEIFFFTVDCLNLSRKIIAPYHLITFGLLVCLEQVFVCIFKSVRTVRRLLSNELSLCSDLLSRFYKLSAPHQNEDIDSTIMPFMVSIGSSFCGCREFFDSTKLLSTCPYEAFAIPP